MKQQIALSKQILLPAQQKDSHGPRRFNCRAVAFHCALLSLFIFGGIVAVQAQQPDPLTVTLQGNVGIGTTAPANKLSVAGNADVTGNVGIGTATPVNKLSVAGNADFSGSVGIGAASPSEKLHVNGAIRVDDAPFKFFVGGNQKGFVGPGRNNDLSLVAKENSKWLRLGSNNGGIALWANGKAETLDTPQFLLNANGNVGIGTTAPTAKLDVAGSGWFRSDQNALPATAGKGVRVFYDVIDAGQIFSYDYSNSKPSNLLLQYPGGNVGIGTANPSKAKLEISGAVGTRIDGFGFLNRDGKTGSIGGSTINYSVWASNSIAALEFHAFSDARIKNIQGRSNSATDLRTLLGIEVTDYRYKDVIGNGNGAYKKVTGQQVEKVFPQAVSKQTQVVPDIYQQASIADGWVALTTDLKKGERVKLITAKGDEGIYEVLEVAQGRFRTDIKLEGNRVFVYGREVKDFLTVDYQAISMLNVSATQQIKKEKDEEVKALQEENAALRSQLAEQEKRLAAIEALLVSNQRTLSAASLKTVKQSKQ